MEENKTNLPAKKTDFELQREKINRTYNFLYPIAKFFVLLFHPIKVMGQENIPEGASLICPNHTSMIDPFLTLFALDHPKYMRAMAKAELMRIPVLGKILASIGVFGVNRGEADTKAIMTAIRYLRAGDKLCIFPEGTRVAEGEDQDAKNGAAMLALKTNSPILPVYIPAKKPWFRKTHIIIGKPFLPECGKKRPTSEDYAAIGADWKRRIKELSEQHG